MITGQDQTDNELVYLQKKIEAARVWESFVAMLRAGQISSIPIRPYHPTLLEPLQSFLRNRHRDANWHEWTVQPEVHRVENQVHFLLDLTSDHDRDAFCFSFCLETDEWYFQHVENITLRLDQLDSLPTNRFPDLPEPKKAWMREEIRVSAMVRLFQWLALEKGRSFALNWFLDGEGYALQAKAWVPFVPAHRAFILYLCWEQSNLYRRAGHLKHQISFDDYRCLFETILADRARNAGWQVAFCYENETCEMFFRREKDENDELR